MEGKYWMERNNFHLFTDWGLAFYNCPEKTRLLWIIKTALVVLLAYSWLW